MQQTQRYLPGTTVRYEEGKDAMEVLDGLFSGGGLVLSQVTALTGLEGYMVQNWIKRGFMTPVVKKRYSNEQFCRLITINMLRDSLSLPEIAGLLSVINGQLDDESDDLIDDSLLYVYFTRTLAHAAHRTPTCFRKAAEELTADYAEPLAGGKERLIGVLCVMCTAYTASEMNKEAKELLAGLPAKD